MRIAKRGLAFSIFLVLILSTIGALTYFGAFGSKLILTKSSFNQLPNWQQDDHDKALQAFKRSCVTILKRDPQASFSPLANAGSVQQWQTICLAANEIKLPDKLAARLFFETWFVPYHVSNYFNTQGLFTGYYLPLLHGRLTPNHEYTIPIYAMPNDLIKADLKLFNVKNQLKPVVGRLRENKLIPYPDRAAINAGSIKKNADVIAWSNDLIDVFFAQIQGSAIVELENQQRFIINYASDNGQPYTAIGKILVEKQQLAKNAVSMQSIRAWLLAHPTEMNDILNHDASYVFFKRLTDVHPLGAHQIPLTPERSLAVDTRYIPLGAPIWLDTLIPENSDQDLQFTTFRQLLIAQDTGGAIKGIVRGDVYWGTGEKATFTAGVMKSPGQYWVLLPKKN